MIVSSCSATISDGKSRRAQAAEWKVEAGALSFRRRNTVELNRFAAAFLVYLAEPRFLGRGFFHAQRAKSDFFEDHGIV